MASTEDRHQAIDSYDVGDLSDDPFASPPNSPGGSKKRKLDGTEEPGDDDEIKEKKRKPTVKLDESKLLGENGIPSLRRRAKHLQIKGYGHEFSDTERLITFFQQWIKDMYPKGKFENVLDMIEKAGHKGRIANERDNWIDEGRRREMNADDEAEGLTRAEEFTAAVAERPKPSVENGGEGGVENDDVPNMDDLPDLDDILPQPQKTPAAVTKSIFGNVEREPDGDDFDAMMAEQEAMMGSEVNGAKAGENGKTAKVNDNFDEEEEAMREMDGMW